jgi:hypothetical protein
MWHTDGNDAQVRATGDDPMSSWCQKCGEQGKPEPAVGLDEDGDLACAIHSAKIEIPVKLKCFDSAAPSRLEATEKEKTDMANEAKVCACGCGSELPTGYKWSRLRGHGGHGNGSALGSRAADHGSVSTRASKRPNYSGDAVQGNQSLVTLQLPACKVEKLLALLLQ